MRRPLLVSVPLLLALTACTGGEPAPAPTAPTASPTPSVTVGDGISTPEALRSFVCEADEKQKWSATGSVRNASKSARTFEVTVQVGPAGDAVAARRITLRDVRPGATAPFRIAAVPTSSDAGPCHVQVLAVE